MTLRNPETEIAGPVLALDLGQKRIGVAVADELLIAISRLDPLRRSSWKQLLRDVAGLVRLFDARALVIGLPLNLDGSRGSAAREVEAAAKKFARSLPMPVYLQDERLSSVAAEERLRAEGYRSVDVAARVDGESAVIILRDFLTGGQERIVITGD